jgi:hypothetical protein
MNKNTPIMKKTLDTILIGISTVIVGLSFGLYSHLNEKNRERNIPIAYSGIQEIEEKARREDTEVGSVDRYYGNLNDLSMAIFHAWNQSYEEGLSEQSRLFRKNLNDRIHGEYGNLSYTLDELFRIIPTHGEEVETLLEPISNAREYTIYINEALSSSWEYTSKDDRIYVPRITDDGVKIESIYIDTTHTYQYNPEEGSKALDGLRKLRESGITFDLIPPQIEIPINNFNVDDESSSLPFSSNWTLNSNYNTYIPEILNSWQRIFNTIQEWEEQINNSETIQYNTSNKTDIGPETYQSNRYALTTIEMFDVNFIRILSELERNKSTIGELESKIGDLLDADISDNRELNRDSREILKIAQSLYEDNFREGLDISGYRKYSVLLMATLGLVIGGLGGGFITYAVKKKIS